MKTNPFLTLLAALSLLHVIAEKANKILSKFFIGSVNYGRQFEWIFSNRLYYDQ